jgi:hypothetical protein
VLLDVKWKSPKMVLEAHVEDGDQPMDESAVIGISAGAFAVVACGPNDCRTTVRTQSAETSRQPRPI